MENLIFGKMLHDEAPHKLMWNQHHNSKDVNIILLLVKYGRSQMKKNNTYYVTSNKSLNNFMFG